MSVSSSSKVNYLLIPALIGAIGLYLLPGLASALFSFTDYNLQSLPRFTGLANYRDVITDSLFWHSIKISFFYTAFVVPTSTLLPLFVAVILSQVKNRSFLSIVYLVPMVISPVAQAFIWIWLFNPEYGLLNTMLNALGLPSLLWLYDTQTALISICFMSLWGFGVGTMIYVASMKSIPNNVIRMTELDGASFFKTVTKVIVPHVYPTILFIAALGFIQSMQVFYPGYLMTDGGPQNATLFHMLYLFRNAFIYNKMGYALAMSTIFAVFLMLLSYGSYRFYNKRRGVA